MSLSPARRRAYNNEPSQRAKDGFRLFHIDGNGVNRRDVCGDCHRFPHLVSTNHPTIGMDTPTWRVTPMIVFNTAPESQ